MNHSNNVSKTKFKELPYKYLPTVAVAVPVDVDSASRRIQSDTRWSVNAFHIVVLCGTSLNLRGRSRVVILLIHYGQAVSHP